jgi:hypothetical protein
MAANQGELISDLVNFSNNSLLNRNASYVGVFTEEEVEKFNVRYLFPSGCEAPVVEIPPIEVKGTAEEVPELICEDTCCQVNRPQIFFPRVNANSCCKEVSKLVVPIDLSVLNDVPTAALDEITSQTDPVPMLLKLVKLIERTRK